MSQYQLIKDYNFNILIVDDSDDLKTLNAFKVKKQC